MIKFDAENNVQAYTLILSKRNHEHLGQLSNISGLLSKINFNAANEISFNVYKYNKTDEFEDINSKSGEDSDIERLWNDITTFKYVYVKELNEYYEINVENKDGGEEYKSVVGASACESELSQVYIYGLEINTEDDIAREEYVQPTIFYNPNNKEASLLNRALYKVPHYTIKHVDSSIAKIQRTFKCDGKDIYSFFTEDVAIEIGCIFIFDSTERSISVYDLKTNCLSCGERGDFYGSCPECGSTSLKFYGEDTTVYFDTENLAEEIIFSTDKDSVKNCFKLEAGDDNMTAAVTNLNPNGSSYIYYFSEEQKKDMSSELIKKMSEYDKLNESYKSDYKNLMINMYETIDKILYYTSEMMPTRENESTNATKEASKLNVLNLSPTGLANVTSSTSVSTVNTALKNYAKVFVNSGKYKIEVKQGSFSYSGIDSGGFAYGYWTGNFVVTNYSDEEDTATSSAMKVKITDSYEEFLEQKINKKLSENRDEEGNIFDVLTIDGLDLFKQALTLYCLNRLTSFYDAIQGAIDIMIEHDQAKKGAYLYDQLYVPYKNKLKACQAEIDKRKKTINTYEKSLSTIEKRQKEIQKKLDFEKYLGTKLYSEFCCFRREDKYSNENYISDGLSNKEMFEKAEEFLKEAKKELIKSGEYQHTITSKLINLMVIEEFKPLWDKFKVGNFVRAGTDRKVYRMRLMSYQIDFDNLENIEVEFSDIAKKVDDSSIINNILSQANSMASSYSSVKHQVDKNKESTNLVKDWVDKGLDLTNMKIISGASNQNFVQNKNGFLIRSYDDVSETYSDEQMKLVNSTLAITDDNWQSIKTAVGKYYYIDPTTGKTKKAYGVNAETIVGKMILGESMGIYSDDGNSSMSFDNKGLIINVNKGVNSQYNNVIDIKIDGVSKFYISRDGDLIINNGKLTAIDADLSGLTDKTNGLIVSLDGFKSEVGAKFKNYSTTAQMNTAITQTAKEINLEVSKKVGKAEIISTINQTAETIKISASKIKLEGVVTANNSFKILTDGSMQATNAKISGTISSSIINGTTINGGTITGTTIKGSVIMAEKNRKVTVYSSDLDIIKNEIMSPGSMNTTYRNRLDLDKNGRISSADYSIAKNILNGITSSSWMDYVYINKNDYSVIVGTKTDDGKIVRETQINPGGILTGVISYSKTSSQDINFYSNSITIGSTNGGNITVDDSVVSTGSSFYAGGAGVKLNNTGENRSLYTTWSDGANHDIVSIAADNRTCYVGAGNYGDASQQTNLRGYKVHIYTHGGSLTSNKSIAVTSDRNFKKNIQEIDIKYINFFKSLTPVTYKYKSNLFDRSHMGFIAQDVEQALNKNGLTTQDFAGIVIDNNFVDPDENTKTLVSQKRYFLRYEEFISLNTYMIQNTMSQLEKQECEIEKLKDNINQLQAKLRAFENGTIECRKG